VNEPCILVVDDDKALLDILVSLLQAEGHEVESVPSAFEALGIVAEPNAPLSAMRTLAKAALQALGER